MYLFYCALPTIKFQLSSQISGTPSCHYQACLLPAVFLVNYMSYFDLKTNEQTNKQKQNKKAPKQTHTKKQKQKIKNKILR